MAAYTTPQPKTRKKSGCNCKEEPAPPCSCCQTICFDRPQYHCGHLLSSEDLTLQLNYDIEKNKLRNRTLFGCGVVCGLRLTCDPNCDGAIRIAKGYALDGCGNDLVVCQSERFNVMNRLREKNLIECPPPKKDPCCDDDTEQEVGCPEKRCFYIVACYCEEEDVFETPFQAGCDPKPAACVPTRVHERVSFDVVACPPTCGCSETTSFRPDPVGVKTLEDSAVGEYMQNNLNAIQTALSGGAVVNQEVDYCEVLCNLKKLFRQYLKEHPAEYTCDLLCQVDCIECPKKDSRAFGADMETAFTGLLNFIFRYGVENAMGELVFDCCEPQDPGCVVLGAVYVENGRLRRVCNTPRQYVMTFNNIWKVLYFELMQKALAELAERQNRGKEPKCCPVFTFDGEMLGQRVAYSRHAMSESVGAFPDAIGALVNAAARSFNFADAANFATKKIGPEQLREMKFSVRDEGVLDASRADFMARDLLASFMSKAPVRQSDEVVAYSIPDEKLSIFMRDVAVAIGAVEPGQSTTSEAVQGLGKRLAEREAQIDQLTAALADVNKRLEALSKGPKGRKGTDEQPD